MARILTLSEGRRLRAAAHHLKPVVQVGKEGVTAAVAAEVERALEAHELIKVRLAAERRERDGEARRLADGAGACLVGTIGAVAILHRPRSGEEGGR